MKLSLLIPARNEMFLKRTIENALENIEDDTEIIAFLDGEWADPEIDDHERVSIIYAHYPQGQRGGTNTACRMSKAKYVMKLDAHCSFDKGFDRKMIEFMEKWGPDITAVPVMRNLWAFDWKCYNCGWKKYQGPTPPVCPQCKKKDKIRKKIMWVGKHNPQSVSYCFDHEPHFQYFEAWKHKEPFITNKKEKRCTETMSLQGSCFMLTRENYWKWQVSDEGAGSWGNQGLEVACATWLSGGRVLVNHDTWYAHMFRTQGGDFGFPWPAKGRETERTKVSIKNKFWDMKHPTQIKPVSWLVEKFWPVKGWKDEHLKALKEHENKLDLVKKV